MFENKAKNLDKTKFDKVLQHMKFQLDDSISFQSFSAIEKTNGGPLQIFLFPSKI